MINYQNPYDQWLNQELMKGLSPEEAQKVGCLSGIGYIVALVVGLLICGLFGSCCPCKNLVNETQTVERDSTETHVKTETIYVTDTLFVEIPKQTAERTTADSVSHLENDYAQSDARINPDGTLFHSLETKPQQKPVEFQKPIEKTDSVTVKYKYKTVKQTKVVEKKLSWWEQLKLDYGGAAIIVTLLLIAFAVYGVVRKFTIK